MSTATEVCPECLDGDVVCDTCDECEERHCSRCEPCDEHEDGCASLLELPPGHERPCDCRLGAPHGFDDVADEIAFVSRSGPRNE